MFNRFLTPDTLTTIKTTFFALVFMAGSAALQAQAGDAQVLAVVDPNPAPKTIYYAPGASANTEIQPTYARWAKKLSAAYEGFAIQLAVTDFPLSRENVLFKRFGRVFYERGEDGKYSYLVLVPNFSSKKAVDEFVEKIIKPRFMEAAAVEYRLGKRN